MAEGRGLSSFRPLANMHVFSHSFIKKRRTFKSHSKLPNHMIKTPGLGFTTLHAMSSAMCVNKRFHQLNTAEIGCLEVAGGGHKTQEQPLYPKHCAAPPFIRSTIARNRWSKRSGYVQSEPVRITVRGYGPRFCRDAYQARA